MRPRFVLLIGALLLAGGCALAPKYARPASPAPPAFPDASGQAAGAPLAADLPWRDFIADPRVQSVVEIALKNNRDLRVAALNVERAEAAYRIQRAEINPGVGATASGDLSRVPGDLSSSGHAYNSKTYQVGVGISAWEIDLFGRLRSLRDQALNQYLATQQARVAAQTALIAQTASLYYELAADTENLRLAESTRETQQRYLDLIQRSRNAGVASDLDVKQTQSQVEAAREEVARYTGLVALDRNALDLVAGAPIPQELLPGGLAQIQPLKPVSPGLPSDTLLRRPDILGAEYRLKAANASIGAARANYFPRISLTTGVGFLSPTLAGLFEGGARTWTFQPTLVTPIFSSGSLKAGVKVTEIERQQAVAQYEQAIQAAFREVSDGLALRTTLVEQKAAQEALVDALDGTYKLSDARYKAGIDSYLGVLVAQRSLFSAQQGLVSLRLAEQQNLVSLYKALGGGL